MELEELDTNLVEIEELKCRTCLFSSEKKLSFTQINQLCSPDRSVKDILIQMVPQLVKYDSWGLKRYHKNLYVLRKLQCQMRIVFVGVASELSWHI